MKINSFYALQPRWTGGDRLYKIYVTNQVLSGARIAGQFFDMNFFGPQLLSAAGIISFLLAPFIKRKAKTVDKTRDDLIAYYDAINPQADGFLLADKHNFQISNQGIRRVVIKRKRSYWISNYPNVGTMKLEMIDGTKRKFIIIGKQDLDQIESLMKKIIEDVVVEG